MELNSVIFSRNKKRLQFSFRVLLDIRKHQCPVWQGELFFVGGGGGGSLDFAKKIKEKERSISILCNCKTLVSCNDLNHIN